MIAVTIGTGDYKTLAEAAARRVRKMGDFEDVVVLGDKELTGVLVDHPWLYHLAVFEVMGDAEDVMLFDADIVMLREWQASKLAGLNALCAVLDGGGDQLVATEKELGVPTFHYFNTGMLVMNRRNHAGVLKYAKKMYEAKVIKTPLREQSVLNYIYQKEHLPVIYLDPMYNWQRYHKHQGINHPAVVMAHFNDGGKQQAIQHLQSLEELETLREHLRAGERV